MKKKSLLAGLLILVATSLLTSCGEKEEDKLGDAQSCLDKATPATAKECITKIQDNTSSGANTLKCAAYFIAEGFDRPDSFTEALDQIKQQPSGCSGCSTTLSAVNVLSFTSAGTSGTQIDENMTNSELALDYCTKSGSQSYSLLATLARFSTILSMTYYRLGFTTTPTATDLQNAITQITSGSGTASAADVGAIASAAYLTTCTDEAKNDTSKKTVCDELSTALDAGSGSNADVGNCLLEKWKNKNYVCP